MRAAQLSLLIISQGAVLTAFWRRGLVRPFLFFSLYVVVLMVRQIRLAFLDPADPEYFRIWALTLILLIPMQILAAGESAYRSLAQFQGVGKGIFFGAVAVAVVMATWIHDLQTHQTHLGAISQADQAVSTALFFAGLAMSAALTWINPERRRSAMLHERLLVFHFGVVAGSLFLLHQGFMWVNVLSMPLAILGFAAWVWLVRDEGGRYDSGYAVCRSGTGAPAGARGDGGWPGVRGGSPAA